MFIIDTNVLIDYPDIVTHENIGIAWSVLEELDRIKITQGERAKKARIVLRKLRDLLEKDEPTEKDEEKKYQEKIEERDTQIHLLILLIIVIFLLIINYYTSVKIIIIL